MFHKPVIRTEFVYKYCCSKNIILRNYQMQIVNLISRNFPYIIWFYHFMIKQCKIHFQRFWKRVFFLVSLNFYLIFLLNLRKIVAFPGLSKYITQENKGKSEILLTYLRRNVTFEFAARFTRSAESLQRRRNQTQHPYGGISQGVKLNSRKK